MDSLVTAAARALAAGDPLGALNRISLREDPPALALRGIAMAQLGELDRARLLVRRAARGFGTRERVARARCIVAEAEIALAQRDLGRADKALEQARATLEACGDWANAAHARHLQIRRLLLVGRLDQAEATLAAVDPAPFPPAWRAGHELLIARVAIRRVQAKRARDALDRAARAAREAGIPALAAEVERSASVLRAPVAELVTAADKRGLRLDEAEALFMSDTLVVDACRHAARHRTTQVSLATRPVLFALARRLAEAWPGDATRSALIADAFRARFTDESHRARLRVEIGRLRAELRDMADVRATRDGFVLSPRHARAVAVIAPPGGQEHAALLALLADGRSWSSSALAIALGTSARTVQRELESLAAAGHAHSLGRGRARRWVIGSVPDFPTTLLLPAPLPGV